MTKDEQATALEAFAALTAAVNHLADVIGGKADTTMAVTIEEPPPPQTTSGDILVSFKAYAKLHGKEAALGLLEAYNAKKISDIKPSQYKAVMEDIDGTQ